MPNVDYRRNELKAQLVSYDQIRDCISGSVAVKGALRKYLPQPNAHDKSPANLARYNNYVLRAVFYNVTRRTVAGLMGQIFMRDPVVEVPEAIKPIVDDTSGEGVGLVQLAKKCANWVLPFGRAGLFIDYPITNGASTQADIEDAGIRPTITGIAPWNIINWRTRKRGALSILSMVVIEEEYTVSDDGFETKCAKQWRVLSNLGDIYTVVIWRKLTDANFYVFKTATPLDANGQPFPDIPFCFIGAETNDSEVDNPPLFDLADLNVAHYRNSADWEESSFLVGQPTPVITGLTEQWADKYFKGGVGMGSRAALPLPVGGKAELLQADPNTMPKDGMEAKERQMVALGAKLVEQKTVQRTATEAGLEEAGETSVLSTVANNISIAFVWALGWVAEYMGITETGIKFQLNTDFDLAKMTFQERAELIKEWQAEAITFGEMRSALRRSGVATEDDTKAQAEIAKQAAVNAAANMALGLDAAGNPINANFGA